MTRDIRSPTSADFEREIRRQWDEAATRGAGFVDVQAGELHRRVGGYPSKGNRMPTCCSLMKRMMGVPNDQILHEPPRGSGASLRIRYVLPRESAPGSAQKERPTPPQDSEGDWMWEGAVQRRIVAHMRDVENFEILATADTGRRQHGPDITAHSRESGRRRYVEVKGYPTTTYARGSKRGEQKPTRPQTQARHWFAQALLSVALKTSEQPEDEVALGLPSHRVYRDLVNRIEVVRRKLALYVYVVERSGEVRLFGPEDVAEPG